MTMKTTFRAIVTAIALLVLEAQTGFAQGQGYARPRDLVALQDDLRLLDDSLYMIPLRNPRQKEFERRAAEIRTDVTRLAEQVGGQNGAPLNYTVPRSEVVALRQRISVLRDDVDTVQTRRAARTSTRRGTAGYVIPQGTEIQVMLEQPLSSETANVEDRVEASTVQAIQVDGRTVVPAGAILTGYVAEVRSNKRLRKDGLLRLEFNTLTPEGGQPMNINSQVISVSETRQSDNTLRNGGIGAVLGAVVGGIFEGKKGAVIGAVVGGTGGALATHGQEVELPQGTLITLRLDGPMHLARR
jgi:hypothetical protein